MEVDENFKVNKEPNEIAFIPEFEKDYFDRHHKTSWKYKVKTILNRIKIATIGREDF